MLIKEAVMKGIEFIEKNLNNDISVRDVADTVSYSQFYYSREFSRYTHISIYDYIIRRKLSESYKDLFRSETKILDIAIKYGFQSHEVYTRAFKKVFGENPSKAVLYKPLALYEAIDENYLDFLYGLKVEKMDEIIEESQFEVDSVSELDEHNSFLVLLSQENLYSCNCYLKGSFKQCKPEFLSFRFTKQKRKIRIYHTDIKFSFRYFIDYFYNVDEMSSNYILISKMKGYIDIIIPRIS